MEGAGPLREVRPGSWAGGRTGAVVSLSFLSPSREGGPAPESMTEGTDLVLKVC